MPKISAIGYVKDGKLTIKDKDKFATAIQVLPNGIYWIEIEKVYSKRSSLQNNALFGIAYKILRICFLEAGYKFTANDVHDFCKNPENNLIPKDYLESERKKWETENKLTNKNTGEVITLPFKVTTTNMSTVYMMEFYTNLQNFAMEYFETDIPDPDPDWDDK